MGDIPGAQERPRLGPGEHVAGVIGIEQAVTGEPAQHTAADLGSLQEIEVALPIVPLYQPGQGVGTQMEIERRPR